MRRRSLAPTSIGLAGVFLAGCLPSAPDPEPTPAGSAAGSSRPPRQQRIDEELRTAAWEDDVEAARRLITAGADVNAKDSTEQSAYLITTSEGHLELLRLTLEAGADVEAKDSWNGTGLIRAAERGHGAVCGELLRAGISRDHVNRIGYQAIHEAVIFGADTPAYRTTVRVLIAGGVALEQPSGTEGLTPREMADREGFDGLGSILRSAPQDPDPAEATARLLAAAAQGEADAAAWALRAGAEIEGRAPDTGATALVLAAREGHPAVAELLLAGGADPSATDQDGVSVREHADRSGSAELTQLLP